MDITPGIIQLTVSLIIIFGAVWRASKAIEDIRNKANSDLLMLSSETRLTLETVKNQAASDLKTLSSETRLTLETVKNQAASDLQKFGSETLLTLEKLKAEDDRLLLFCNGNKELIDHRTSRLNGSVEKLTNDLREVQRYLDSTTSYTIREREHS